MKRLRKKFSDVKIRDLHCGEYGENLGRPHHHACLFNFEPPDKKLWKVKEGNRYYTSEILTDTWGHGHVVLGDVTFDSAAYVARYIEKKITGENADGYYDGRKPEYSTMSRRPGLGQGWYEKYKDDAFGKDFIMVRGVRCSVPKFYNKKYELTNPDEYGMLSEKRKQSAKQSSGNREARLIAGEKIKKAQLVLAPRNEI